MIFVPAFTSTYRAYSVLNVKVQVGPFNQEKGLSWGLLCEIFANLRLTLVSSSTIQVLAVLAAAVLPRHLPGRAPLLPPVLSVYRGLQEDRVVDYGHNLGINVFLQHLILHFW